LVRFSWHLFEVGYDVIAVGDLLHEIPCWHPLHPRVIRIPIRILLGGEELAEGFRE